MLKVNKPENLKKKYTKPYSPYLKIDIDKIDFIDSDDEESAPVETRKCRECGKTLPSTFPHWKHTHRVCMIHKAERMRLHSKFDK